MPPTMAEIIVFIMDADEGTCKAIRNALDLRTKTLRDIQALIAAEELYVGDRVITASNLTPKKISNQRGYIKEIKETRRGTEYVIKFDTPVPGWGGVRLLAHNFKKLEEGQ